MVKVPNLRIEISEDARRALNFEVALTGESLSACASLAILNGVSDKAAELAGLKSPKCVVVKSVRPNNTVTTNARVPIKDDPDAINYIVDNMDTLSGVRIAKALSRSVSSVNKYIKSIRDDKLIVRG